MPAYGKIKVAHAQHALKNDHNAKDFTFFQKVRRQSSTRVQQKAVNFDYRESTIHVNLGSQEFHLAAIADISTAIDTMFDELERRGHAEILNELCPFFGALWPAALALCRFLVSEHQRQPDAFIRARSLELGCGLALPSLLLNRLGAIPIATDSHPDVADFLRRNCQLNDLKSLNFLPFDWTGSKPDLPGMRSIESIAEGEPLDWIVASDILYEPAFAPALAQTLAKLAGPETKIAISDPGRPYLQDFVNALEKHSFSTALYPIASGPSPTGGREIPDTECFVIVASLKSV